MGPLYLFFLLSGAAGLMYELLWLRSFSLLFGNTTQASAAVFAAFFGGMALGNAVLGRRADRVRNPLRLYATLEILIPLAAFSVDLVLEFYPRIVALFPDSLLPSHGLGMLLKLALAGISLIVPTFLMGGTLPVMIRAVTATEREWRRRTPVMYAVHLVGACAGILLGGFLLPHRIGVQNLFFLAAILNVIAAAGSFWMSRRPSMAPVHPLSDSPILPVPASQSLLAFGSGMGMLAMEMLWIRMFSLVLQNSVYTFSAVLLMTLTGLSLGAFVTRFLPPAKTRSSCAVFLALTGAMIFATPFAFLGMTHGLSFFAAGAGWFSYLAQVSGLAAVMILLPAACGGTILPLVWRWSSPTEGRGRHIGRLTAINTLGAIVGSLVTGFVLIPALGLWTCFLIVGIAYGMAAMVLAPRVRRVIPIVVGTAVVVAVALFVHLPVAHVESGERLLFVSEGRSGVVTVIESGGDRLLKIDNHYTLGSMSAAMEEARQGHLPLLLHPAPKEVAFIGIATGITVGAAVDHPVERIAAIEIVPEVIDALPYFSPYHREFMKDPRVRIVVGDGRIMLTSGRQTYDVIVSDLFTPWHAGTGAMYTVDFYGQAAAKLNAGGLFCQWLPLHQLSEREFHIIAAGFCRVFPNVTLWKDGVGTGFPVVALIGSRGPLRIDGTEIQKRLDRLPIRDRQLADTSSLLQLYLGDLSSYGPYRTMEELNTDRYPLIEFSAPISERERKTFTGETLKKFLEQLPQSEKIKNYMSPR